MSAKLQQLKAKTAEKKESIRYAISSWGAFKESVKVHDTALDQHSHREDGPTWSNEDLDPTPPEKRTWSWYNYVIFCAYAPIR